MSYQYFFNHTLRNISISLLNIINDMYCVNYDTSGNVVKEIPVPVIFNVPEKDFYFRTISHYYDYENNEVNERYYVSKPRMNLSFASMSYDSRRQSDSNSITEWIKYSIGTSGSDIQNVLTNYNPTPYTYEFTLDIKTESWLHLTEIIEQFLVFFNPAAQLRVKEFNDVNIERDLKVSITSINFNINEDLDSQGFKQADATIGLSVEGYLYKPLSNSGLIKEIITNYNTSDPTSVSAVNVSTYKNIGLTYTSAVSDIALSAIPANFFTSAAVSGASTEQNYVGYLSGTNYQYVIYEPEWDIDSLKQITWTTDDFYYSDMNEVIQPDTIKLEISRDGGSTWNTIIADTPNTGSYDWTVTGPTTLNAIIRYSGVNNTEITAVTTEFSIV